MWGEGGPNAPIAPLQIYAFGHESNDVMLFGTVDYELKDGRKTRADWGARAQFANEDGELKMQFYQVYLASILSTECAATESNMSSRIVLP
ncbi:hypothetical protein MRB53_038383 [Persea americana]|nr:hypothetical protein MRB53_038383 [Persea americana]